MIAVLPSLLSVAVLALSTLASTEINAVTPVSSSIVLPLRYKSYASTIDHDVIRGTDGLEKRRHHRHRKPPGAAGLKASTNRAYVTDVEIGAQKYELSVATSYGDTWVLGNGTICLDLHTRDPLEAPNCSFGPVYTSDETFRQIQNQHFRIFYPENYNYAYGKLGLERVKIGGLTLSNQTIGVATEAAWDGDGDSSGVLGLGREWETKAYADSDSSEEGFVTKRPYTPISANIPFQNNLPQVFSLALDGRGGSLAFGYATAPHASADFVRTPFLDYDPRYLISLDDEGLIFEGSNQHIDLLQEHRREVNGGTPALPARIESSTPLIIVPRVIAENFAAVFQPKAISDGSQIFHVDCKAKAPPLAVRIAGREFKISAEDLIIDVGDQGCISAVMSFDDEELSVLGQPFLKSVYAVFDIGAGEMRFAAQDRDD